MIAHSTRGAAGPTAAGLVDDVSYSRASNSGKGHVAQIRGVHSGRANSMSYPHRVQRKARIRYCRLECFNPTLNDFCGSPASHCGSCRASKCPGSATNPGSRRPRHRVHRVGSAAMGGVTSADRPYAAGVGGLSTAPHFLHVRSDSFPAAQNSSMIFLSWFTMSFRSNSGSCTTAPHESQ